MRKDGKINKENVLKINTLIHLFVKVLIVVSLVSSSSAYAGLIKIEGHGVVNRSLGFSEDYLPIGTTIHASVVMEISGDTPSFGNIQSASGTFSWNDGELRTFNVNGGRHDAISGAYVGIEFTGTGPIIDGITPNWFGIGVEFATDPFSNAIPWERIILNSSFLHMRVGLQTPITRQGTNGVQFHMISNGVSGEVSSVTVPEPSTFAIFGLGVLGLVTRRFNNQS